MKRRQFLGGALAGAGGVILGCGGGEDVVVDNATTSGAALSEGLPLRALARLENSSNSIAEFTATLSAAPSSAELQAGTSTPLYLYNNTAPGPLIELFENQRVAIRLDNQLPHETTI